MTIGERIKELRTEKGLSLRELAKSLNITAQTLQRYETGTIKNISPEMVNKLASALGTSASWLLGEHEQTAKNAVTVELSSTESMLLKMYREFSPDEKEMIRSMIMHINDSRYKQYDLEKRLHFAEEFIHTTEYHDEYRREHDEEFGGPEQGY